MSFGTNRTLPILLDERASFEGAAKAAKHKVAEINEEILAIARHLAEAAYKRAEKADGTVKFAQGDAIYKAEIDKTVKYDSAALFEVARRMPWEEASAIFKFELSVGEKVFKALPEGPVKDGIMEARTVKYSDPKISNDA